MLTFANFALRTESIFGCLGTDAKTKPWAPKSRVPQFSAGDGDSSDEELIRTKPAEDMPTLFPTEECDQLRRCARRMVVQHKHCRRPIWAVLVGRTLGESTCASGGADADDVEPDDDDYDDILAARCVPVLVGLSCRRRHHHRHRHAAFAHEERSLLTVQRGNARFYTASSTCCAATEGGVCALDGVLSGAHGCTGPFCGRADSRLADASWQWPRIAQGSSTVDTGTRATNSSARSRLTTSLACRKQRHAHLRRTVRTPPCFRAPGAVLRTLAASDTTGGRHAAANCSRTAVVDQDDDVADAAGTRVKPSGPFLAARPPARPLRSTPVHGPSGSNFAVPCAVDRSCTAGGVRSLSARALRRSVAGPLCFEYSQAGRCRCARPFGRPHACPSAARRARALAASAQGASFRMSPRALSATHRRFASHRRVPTGSILRCA